MGEQKSSIFNIQEELKKMPDKPGVYIMKNINSDVIYVGKAVNLKNRVKQYFQSLSNQTQKVKAMVQRIDSFEYIVTDSEMEALILECNLIKKYKPRFNVLLKDDKNYPYIKVSMNEEYPRIFITRRIEKDKAKYFGPYTSASAVRETLDLLKKIFPTKQCKKILPRDIGKNRPCLNYYIYQCLAPCQGNVNREEYRAIMKDICSFLGGRQEEMIKRLERLMEESAKALDYEKAADLRDKINSIKHIAEKQKIVSTTMEDQDVIAFAREELDTCVYVFFIRGGKLIGRKFFIFEETDKSDNRELMTAFIKQFYSSAKFIPKEILIQEDIDEKSLIEEWLSGKRASKVYIKVPKRGEKCKLVEMVSQNASISLRQFKDKMSADEKTAKEGLSNIAEIFGLEQIPKRIEAYDISNTGSLEIVSSMVVFENGMPYKKEYRRFKIKSIKKQNDYASMQETVYRRFKRAMNGLDTISQAGAASEITPEQKQQRHTANGKFTVLPDLILVDGGRGHVNAVMDVIKEFELDIPVIGMVKDDKHRTRGLVSEDREVDLSGNLPSLRLITAIQNEAHRFALEYNKKLRKKRYTGSVLDEIEGIGEKRRKALLKHFGSIDKIRRASVDELLDAKGISRTAAQNVYKHFHE